jgi:hypothetical protein
MYKLTLLLLLLSAPAYAGEQTRFYAPDGRSTGTAATNGEGTTTFRDARGNVVGRASRPLPRR